jgi:hypothetical protein
LISGSTETSEPNYWYRYEDFREADYDPWAEYEQPSSNHAALRLRKFLVLKETPKGVWLDGDRGYGNYTGKTFVLKEANKRWACPTIEEAEESWRARKAKQAKIYTARLRSIEEAIKLMDRNKGSSYAMPDCPLTFL